MYIKLNNRIILIIKFYISKLGGYIDIVKVIEKIK